MRAVAIASAIVMLSSGAPAQTTDIVVPLGTELKLETVTALSSKSAVKGDMVALRVAEDVAIAGKVVILRGTEAIGQVFDARAKGAMGMSGRIFIRPLYAKVGSKIVRLSGQAVDKASVAAGAVLGTIAIGAPFFTGRSAEIPAGTRINAVVEKTVSLTPLK